MGSEFGNILPGFTELAAHVHLSINPYPTNIFSSEMNINLMKLKILHSL